MPRYLWLRVTLVLAVIVGSAALVSPRDWRGQPRQPINLGLDLQGGIHMVLGVDLEKGIDNVLDREYETFGLFGDAEDVLGPEFDDSRFLSPAAPRAAWLGVRVDF